MQKIKSFHIAITLIFFLLSCIYKGISVRIPTTPSRKHFEKTINGKRVSLYTLKNKNGIELKLTNYGARFVSFIVPDKNGNFNDIILGYNSIEEYENDGMYMGCIVGRFANRIRNGKYTIDGIEYEAYINNDPNTLHGGKKGFDKVVWDVKQDSNSIVFSYLSEDGEEGYPGNLYVTQKVTLNDNNEIVIDYKAKTDKKTVINLSNHSYYNLKGEGDSTILDHYLMINADYYTPVDSTLIPTGELAKVKGTPFDFTSSKPVGRDVDSQNIQLLYGRGYDHNWVLNNNTSGELSFALRLSEETTGRVMEFWTTQPGLQFYGGNFMNGKVIGKSGRPYKYRSAVVLEPQHFPDSPNQPSFPSTVLVPGKEYKECIVIKIYVR